MLAIEIQKKRIFCDRKTEMIANPFMKAVAFRYPEGGCQINASLPKPLRVDGTQFTFHKLFLCDRHLTSPSSFEPSNLRNLSCGSPGVWTHK